MPHYINTKHIKTLFIKSINKSLKSIFPKHHANWISRTSRTSIRITQISGTHFE